MNNFFVTMADIAITFATSTTAQTYLENLNAKPFLPKAPPQPANTFDEPYGNKNSNNPQLFNNQSQYRSNLNTNLPEANSFANAYVRYGSQYSPDSPSNTLGSELTII
jgi:hypothetical protein